jgi:hypothetical protein
MLRYKRGTSNISFVTGRSIQFEQVAVASRHEGTGDTTFSSRWKEQSNPILRFWAEGVWWGFPFFSLSASRYFGEKQTLCLYWPLATVVIAGPKALDFYVGVAPPGNVSQIGWLTGTTPFLITLVWPWP